MAKRKIMSGGPIPFPNSAWDYEFDAVFTGTQSLEIPTAQTITSDYQCFFESELTPKSPDNAEYIYRAIGGFYVIGTNLTWFGNGLTSTVIANNVVQGESNSIKIYLKIGALKCVCNNEETEITGITWANLTWPMYTIAVGGSNLFSGNISYFKDLNETFNFRNESLVGSLGTIPVETGVITFEAQGPSVPIGKVVYDTTDGIVKIMTAGGLVPV